MFILKEPQNKNKASEFEYYSFFRHFARNLLIGFIITMIFLFIGMIGFHHYENIDWMHAYANAAMIMSGVGPLSTPNSDAGKFFIGTYSLVSGIGFLLVIGIILAPIFHWLFRHANIVDRD